MNGTIFRPRGHSEFFSPVEGDTFAQFIDFLRSEEKIDDRGIEIIRSNAIRILSKCLHPNCHGDHNTIPPEGRTNVHVADVQSGKTLTMCSVLALAYDNGIHLTTILTGTKNILKAQSIDRIQETLWAIDPGNEKFYVVTNLKNQDQIPLRLAELTRTKRFTLPKMIIFTLLKEAGSITKLAGFLRQAGVSSLPIPSLMMDDEADQASPNTDVADKYGGASSTYTAIKKLRSVHSIYHTFIQVTATAQGLFCIPEDDFLSPEYVTLSDRNQNYIGIDKYFGSKEAQQRYIFRIPAEDITNPGTASEPPQSLVDAVDYYLVAVSVLRSIGEKKPLSMLCHPHSRQSEHTRYKHWIEKRITFFKDLIDEGEEEIVFDGLKKWFDECRKKSGAFYELSYSSVKEAIGKTIEGSIVITIINTNNTIDSLDTFWKEKNHILIGGSSIERGFTVVGILVTYLCRSTGMNSDTIQQRARFCGYKSELHLHASRLWLDEENIRFFRHYIVTEKSVRNRLAQHIDERKPFLKSGFAITMLKGFRPTRTNIHKSLNTGSVSEWFSPGYSHFLEQEDRISNVRLLSDLLVRLAHKFCRTEQDKNKRAFFCNQLTIADLKIILSQFKTNLSNTAARELILSVLESFPDDYPDSLFIHACWLCDTAALQYSRLSECMADSSPLTSAQSYSYPKALIQGRTLKNGASRKTLKIDSADLSAYSINLRRGATKNYLRDDDLVDPDHVTIQFSFFDFQLDEKSFGDMPDHSGYATALKLFNPGLAGVVQVKLPELGNWIAFSQ
jgi:hypothetical protein